MEEGSFRCDANISVRPAGSREFGRRMEIKNLNSFKAIQAALAYEENRLRSLLAAGTSPEQEESRGWDETRGMTFLCGRKRRPQITGISRSDLPPLVIAEEWVEADPGGPSGTAGGEENPVCEGVRVTGPGCGPAGQFRETAEFFEATLRCYSGEPKTVANWVMGDFARFLNLEKLTPAQSKLKPEALAAMLQMIDDGQISGKIAKTVFEEMFYSGKSPRGDRGGERAWRRLAMKTSLPPWSGEILAKHPGPVADYRAGKTKALGFWWGK